MSVTMFIINRLMSIASEENERRSVLSSFEAYPMKCARKCYKTFVRKDYYFTSYGM